MLIGVAQSRIDASATAEGITLNSLLLSEVVPFQGHVSIVVLKTYFETDPSHTIRLHLEPPTTSYKASHKNQHLNLLHSRDEHQASHLH